MNVWTILIIILCKYFYLCTYYKADQPMKAYAVSRLPVHIITSGLYLWTPFTYTIWRVTERMYQTTKKEISNQFDLTQGEAKGCSLSPLFSDLWNEFERSGSGVRISELYRLGGIMFADDFVDLAGNEDDFTENVVYWFCKKWTLRTNNYY